AGSWTWLALPFVELPRWPGPALPAVTFQLKHACIGRQSAGRVLAPRLGRPYPLAMKRPAAAMKRPGAASTAVGAPCSFEAMAVQAGLSDSASQGEIIRVAEALTREFWSCPRYMGAAEMFSGSGRLARWMRRAGLQCPEFDKYGRDESEDVCTLADMAFARRIVLSIKPKGTLVIAPPSREWASDMLRINGRDDLANGKISAEGMEANDLALAVAHFIAMCVVRDVFFMVVMPFDCQSFFEYPAVNSALRLGRAAITTTYQGNWQRISTNKRTLVSSNIAEDKMARLLCECPLPDSTHIDEVSSRGRDVVKWSDGTYELNEWTFFYDGFAKELVAVVAAAAELPHPVFEAVLVNDSESD
ncbi:unnamed protein product, partial [Prorocentrum cordatum]